MGNLDKLRKDLRSFQRPGKSKILQRFFKTGKGEYGEGDGFLGLMTDETRSIAKKYLDLSFFDISKLFSSEIHEERVVAVMILCQRFKKGDFEEKKGIFDFYFENISGINNWDLVDCSAPGIVGEYLSLSGVSKEVLYKLARSNNLWKKRITMMATFYFIRLEKEILLTL